MLLSPALAFWALGCAAWIWTRPRSADHAVVRLASLSGLAQGALLIGALLVVAASGVIVQRAATGRSTGSRTSPVPSSRAAAPALPRASNGWSCCATCPTTVTPSPLRPDRDPLLRQLSPDGFDPSPGSPWLLPCSVQSSWLLCGVPEARSRHVASNSVRVTGRSLRLARPCKIAGMAVTVPGCPRWRLTIDPRRTEPSTLETTASGTGSV